MRNSQRITPTRENAVRVAQVPLQVRLLPRLHPMLRTGVMVPADSKRCEVRCRVPYQVRSRLQAVSGRHSLPELPDVMYDNPGIDAEVTAGSVAQAVYAGKVSGVYMIPGFSTVVIVSHGNYYTVYGNLSGSLG